MFAVTIGAVRGIYFLSQIGLPVRAVVEVFRPLGMTGGAVNLTGCLTGTLQAGINIRVTFDTGNVFMGGIL